MPFRLRLMLAIHAARAEGFHHFAAALETLLAQEIAANE
jgi:hypothetical protein